MKANRILWWWRCSTNHSTARCCASANVVINKTDAVFQVAPLALLLALSSAVADGEPHNTADDQRATHEPSNDTRNAHTGAA